MKEATKTNISADWTCFAICKNFLLGNHDVKKLAVFPVGYILAQKMDMKMTHCWQKSDIPPSVFQVADTPFQPAVIKKR